MWAIAGVLLAGVAAGGASLALALTSESFGRDLGEPLVIALLSVWLTVSYVFCGLLAWWRRPDSRFGPLMCAAGVGNFVATLSWSSSDVVFTAGQAFDFVPPVLFLHVFLAFPSGRLSGPRERALVVSAYATAVGLELVRMAFGGFGPRNLLEVDANAPAALVALRVQLLLISSFCLAGVAILAVRRRRRGRPLRGSLTLLNVAFGLALVMIAVLFLSHAFDVAGIAEIRWATFVALGIAPVAFLVGLLRTRLARSAVGDLLVGLRSAPAPADLQEALARALRDPSLTLAFWLPDFDTYTDAGGRPLELPSSDARGVTLIDRDGAPFAALLHHRALVDEPELLAGVTAGAAMAIENARLHAELNARLVELRGSRARVIEAGQSERQRLERNLHDGAQQRLIALSLELSLLEERLAHDEGAAARLTLARREIAASLEELREVARGLHPAVVTGHGIGVALEQLAAHAPVPVRLAVDTVGRLPEALEVAAYYVVSESLANVARYARASSATVEIAQEDDVLRIEIVDDGVGGADTESGSGLRGLADRVEALGGRFRVWSPSGGGTRVRAEIPCES